MKRTRVITVVLLAVLLLVCPGAGAVKRDHPAGLCKFECWDFGYVNYELRDDGCWCSDAAGASVKIWSR